MLYHLAHWLFVWNDYLNRFAIMEFAIYGDLIQLLVWFLIIYNFCSCKLNLELLELKIKISMQNNPDLYKIITKLKCY